MLVLVLVLVLFISISDANSRAGAMALPKVPLWSRDTVWIQQGGKIWKSGGLPGVPTRYSWVNLGAAPCTPLPGIWCIPAGPILHEAGIRVGSNKWKFPLMQGAGWVMERSRLLSRQLKMRSSCVCGSQPCLDSISVHKRRITGKGGEETGSSPCKHPSN